MLIRHKLNRENKVLSRNSKTKFEGIRSSGNVTKKKLLDGAINFTLGVDDRIEVPARWCGGNPTVKYESVSYSWHGRFWGPYRTTVQTTCQKQNGKFWFALLTESPPDFRCIWFDVGIEFMFLAMQQTAFESIAMVSIEIDTEKSLFCEWRCELYLNCVAAQ